MPKEIERTWLCRGYLHPELHPEITYAAVFTDSTSYLFVGEEFEIRIRKREFSDNTPTLYWVGVKAGNGLVRDEYEEKITHVAYTELLKSVPYPPVITDAQKCFALHNGANIKIYVSNTDRKFFRAEIEFPDEEAARAFVCPFEDWEETTDDPRYAMKNYWVNTRIKGEVYNGK